MLRRSNRRRILEAMKKRGEIGFNELLRLEIVSKEPLSRHLKHLLRTKQVEKHFSKAKNREIYRLTIYGEIPLIVDGMIHYLGTIATHAVFAKKLGVRLEFSINKEIEKYIEAKSEIPPEKFYKYLKDNHPLIV